MDMHTYKYTNTHILIHIQHHHRCALTLISGLQTVLPSKRLCFASSGADTEIYICKNIYMALVFAYYALSTRYDCPAVTSIYFST